MNILQVLPELNVGGVERGTVELAKQLVKLGHKAVVVSAGGELTGDLRESGVIHYQLPVNQKSLWTMARTVRPLIDIIRKEEIDIVHARSRVPAWIAYFAARAAGKIFLTTCHGYYKKHLFSYVMGWAKRVIVVSNVIAKHMIDDFGVPYERIRLIPRSVDLEKFEYRRPDTKKRNGFNVGIIGRITPLKGHAYFIKAMARVFRAVPQLKIWIVGEAPVSKEAYKQELEVLVRRLGLWHCTEFLGTQRDIPAVLAHLDVLVLATTTHEAFGRVIVEAQASGVPVVATAVGGVIDVVENEKTGLLVPAADPNSMAEAVIRISKDQPLACALAENAYKRVKEKYSLGIMVKNTLDVYQDAASHFKILIIKLSSLGDVILATAAIRAIREKFPPNYEISVLVGEESKDALLRCPYINELLVCDFKNRDRGIKGLLKLAHSLRKKGFDIVIDLQNNRSSHILAFLSASLARYGYDNKKFGFLLNRRVRDTKEPIGPVAHQFRVLRMLGIDLPGPGTQGPALELWPSDDDRNFVDEFLNSQWLSPNQKIIGINLSASPRWLSKSWPLKSIARLCEELERRDIRVVVTGTEKDLNQAEALVNRVRNARVINACAKTTVNELACLIARCSVYISSDSASLHVASAMKVPLVALFGPTDPARHLPPAKDYLVIKKDLPCRPCYRPDCKSRRCMELITPEEVLEAVDKLLKNEHPLSG